MRKSSRTSIPVVVAAFLLAACGGGGTDPVSEVAPEEESVEAPTRGDADLVIWTDALKEAAVTSVAEPFGERNGISVAVQVVSSDLQANFVTANAAGNGPDVVVGAHDWIGNLVQNGAIEPLQLTPDQLAGYSDVAVQATTYNGRLYGVPYGVETLGLYRNTDLAPEAPTTLDDAIEAGQAAVRAHAEVDSALNVPVGDLGDAYHMQPLFTSLGGYLFGTDADGGFDPQDLGVGGPGSIAAAERIHRLGEQGDRVLRRSISSDNSIALFTEGKAAFLISGPWALGDIRNSGIAYDVQPVPAFAGAEDAKPFMGAQAFMVAAAGKNKAFAQEFVTRAVNTEEAMITMFEGAKLPPSMTAVAESIAQSDADIATFAAAAAVAAPMPAIPEMSAVWEPLGKAYAAIVGGADPEKTIRDAGATIQRNIG
ncbi:sugar ABC transporter substrate-binding protein [Nocardioides limicola]|uniref:sugar ABC transporter substrate-binding protein n=1 Tax=Nocardioides limicola TaxID=2803368 RepID=UPI00193B0398|nr:extracellular solute-binding protein [Nocardioides sp. DJM-14]